MTDKDPMTLIEEKLTAALAPIQLKIRDDSHQHRGHIGARNGGHFSVFIVSAQFQGQTLVQRHRLVFAALDELMKTTIHALSIEAKSPTEISK